MSIEGTHDPIAPGSRIGKYEVVRRLAYGGMAEIYLVRVSGIHGFEKHLVLKRILPQFAAREDFLHMFLREARLAATLDQANIAHVYDIGELGGSYFYTMEYLHGEDLRRIMRHLRQTGARLPLPHALGIAAGVACGLHYAHDRSGADGRPLGIVHRDVSPSNIVVTFHGGVKLVDFGIAKITSDPDLTRGNGLKGKVAYMSPEQLNGRPLDRRSDVFSLGIVLYETTTHRRLYAGENDVDLMRAAMEGDVPLPTAVVPDYPRDLEAVVMRALERDPERRYPTARDLQRDIEAFALAHRAQISSAALAEWMGQTYGDKPEPWQDAGSGRLMSSHLPGPAAPSTTPPAAAPAAPAGDDGPTRVAPRADVITPPPQPRHLLLAELAAAGVQTASVNTAPESPGGDSQNTPPTVAPPAPARRRSRARRVLMGAVAAIAIVAGGAAGLAHFRHRPATAATSAQAGTATPVLVLVAEGGRVAVDSPAAGLPAGASNAAATAPAPAPAAPGPAQRGDAKGARGARATARNKAGRALPPAGANQPPAFSVALARRESELRSCVTAHSSAASGDSAIEFRFRIRADGHVESVNVLPDSVAGTALGACLAKVGASTVFAPQPQPVAFRIPLSMRLHQAETKSRP